MGLFKRCHPLIKQAVTTTSGGTFTLGSAATGYVALTDYYSDGNEVDYYFTDGTDWEYGSGRWNGVASEFERDGVVDSSASGGGALALTTGATGTLSQPPLPFHHEFRGAYLSKTAATATGDAYLDLSTTTGLATGTEWTATTGGDKYYSWPKWSGYYTYDLRISCSSLVTGESLYLGFVDQAYTTLTPTASSFDAKGTIIRGNDGSGGDPDSMRISCSLTASGSRNVAISGVIRLWP